MDYRSPLDSIFGIIGGLPQGHDKPVKHALYNAVALLLLFLSCAAAWALYIILEPFIKPLIWALLVGSALHPLKRSLRDRFNSWFENLEDTHTPVVLGIALIPVNIINDLAEFIGSNLAKRWKIIVGVGVAIPVAHITYNYTPNFISSLLWIAAISTYKIFNLFLDNSTLSIVSLIIVGYLTAVFLLWKPENNTAFHYASMVVWLLSSCCLAQQFGGWCQMPIFILLQIVFFGGFVSEVLEIHSAMKAAGQPISFTESLSLAFHDKSIDLETSDENIRSEEESDKESSKEKSNTSKEKSIKFQDVDTAGAKGDSNNTTIPSQPIKKVDPWSMDLFNEDAANNKLIKRTDSQLSAGAGVLITNQGIQFIQQTPPAKDPRKKLLRSLSQPQFYGRKSKNSIFNLTRKLSLRNSDANLQEEEQAYGSTFYLYSILWACVVMLFWKNIMLLPLLPIPILLYIIKHLGYYLGIWGYLKEKLDNFGQIIWDWCDERHDALVPVPIRGLYKFVHKINSTLKNNIKESIDTVASCVVIFGLIVFLICASIFIALQIYAEGIMLVQMTSNVINNTVVHNPELRQLLPPAWDETVDSVLDNAYMYGREGISKGVKSILADHDSAKSEKIEKQILELWDRLYQSWMSSDNANGPKVTEDAVKTSWDAFINDIKKSPEMFNINGIVDFAKQNVGTLMSLLESIWSIVKGNIGLVLSSFSAFLSVILGGGTAVLNFILNTVVFLTTLFYLLNSSGDLYKPVELMTNFSPSGSRFGHALEAAVNGVFSASFKMAAFYGLWTWFIHNLFGVRIVYLPTVFATILGAVPFLGTYWACVPAVLDLWLAQDRGIAAILFAACQFLPTSVVDTTIYKEIKGGHPYLTGLAIAGGIFCLGVEGAIFGPLLLCGLYVAIDLSSSLFKESPSEESLNIRFRNN